MQHPLRLITVAVTKPNIDKAVKDSELEISKGFEVAPVKEIQGPSGGLPIRIGVPGGHSIHSLIVATAPNWRGLFC